MSQSGSNTEISDSQGSSGAIGQRTASASPSRRTKRRKTKFETALKYRRDDIRITLDQDNNVNQLLKDEDSRTIFILNQGQTRELTALIVDVKTQLRRFHHINEVMNEGGLAAETGGGRSESLS